MINFTISDVVIQWECDNGECVVITRHYCQQSLNGKVLCYGVRPDQNLYDDLQCDYNKGAKIDYLYLNNFGLKYYESCQMTFVNK